LDRTTHEPSWILDIRSFHTRIARSLHDLKDRRVEGKTSWLRIRKVALRAIFQISSWQRQQYVPTYLLHAPYSPLSLLLTHPILTYGQPLIAYFVIRNLLTRLDPEHQQKEEARAKASAATRKLDAILTSKRKNKGDYDEYDSEDEETDSRRGRPRIQDLNLNTYEQTIAMEVVAPEEIPVSFEGTYKTFFWKLTCCVLKERAHAQCARYRNKEEVC
jgi:hypothetical protein